MIFEQYQEEVHIPAWDENDDDFNMRMVLDDFYDQADAIRERLNAGDRFSVWGVSLMALADGWSLTRLTRRYAFA